MSAASTPTALTRLLAERILRIGSDDITPLALSQAKMCLVDAVGVSLAGSLEPATRILLDTPGIATAPGCARIIGSTVRTSALDATLVNGTSAHALDYDDFSSIMGGHHTVPLMPALLAVGEERSSSGREIVTAYVAGVEVQIRMARALGFHHYDKGWHPTATIGTFGAAAAAAHLLGLDVAQTATALAMAASLSSGLKANFGTMVKPLHAGHCGRNGLLAALLAQRGFDANDFALEHHQGFLNVFNGAGTFDIEKLFDGWAAPLEIEGDTIALKQFPCCGSTHPAIAMMLRLVREEGVSASDVVAIDVMPHARRLRHTDNASPTSSLEAKFSVQYATVRALLDGTVRLRHFEGGAHEQPEIRELLSLTTARPHPDMLDDAPQQWGAEVRVTLRSGQRLSRRVDQLVGRGGATAMTVEEQWEKFQDCGERSLPADQLHEIFDMLQALERVEDINGATRLLQPASA